MTISGRGERVRKPLIPKPPRQNCGPAAAAFAGLIFLCFDVSVGQHVVDRDETTSCGLPAIEPFVSVIVAVHAKTAVASPLPFTVTHRDRRSPHGREVLSASVVLLASGVIHKYHYIHVRLFQRYGFGCSLR